MDEGIEVAQVHAGEDEKGGNSYFTAGGFRFCHSGIEDAASDVLTDLSDAERQQIVKRGEEIVDLVLAEPLLESQLVCSSRFERLG